MAEREKLLDISRQSLIIGTSCITDATGNIGYKTDLVQASASLRIADALEKQNELTRITGPGFQPEQYLDGRNHLAMQVSSDSRVGYIQLLGVSPEMVLRLSREFGDVLQEMVRIANEEGGPNNG